MAELDPAATDGAGENARDGARKRRDPGEPAAVVGLGASAGGIAVLQQFFSDMPSESGLAFVVVMHLSPEHESNLAGIIQLKTSMPVTQVQEPVQVQPNRIYVIPPNKQLTFTENTLQLIEPQQAAGRRVTIDLFFRTLAQSYGHRSVGIILSGSDSDGVIGLKHIRAQGGVTIAQDPKEAEYDSMPLTAIATGMVDWVLPVSEMTPRLLDLIRNENLMRLPPEIPEAEEADKKVKNAAGGETISDETRDERDESALREVLVVLRRQTGHDFSHYKRATFLRRVARRLQVNSLESIPEYLKFLRQHPSETSELLQDLLIGVTHFFRDQAAFAMLEAHIPQLFAGKLKGDQLRVWVAGCATGEEAYSIAMLLCEHAERLEHPPAMQIFATDIDDQAIQVARQGIYPTTIEADVSAERLRRFFARDHGRYRVRKSLREKVLFAAHNLLSDAPFSNLDLVSCRNLLIYLNQKTQDQVFDIFHFSLRSGGLLFLGGSEAATNAEPMFSPIDGKQRVYVRRSVPRPSWKIPLVPARARDFSPLVPRSSRGLAPLSGAAIDAASSDTRESAQAGQDRRSMLFGELHLKLLEQYAPPSVVVNSGYDIVHLSEHAGRYLHFVAGEPTANLMKAVDPALQMELRTALFRASKDKTAVEGFPIPIEVAGQTELVAVTVRPIRSDASEEGFYLVTFTRNDESAGTLPAAPASPNDLSRDLHAEIDVLKRQLNDTSEQYEAATEELKASNEELQAINEELRSATEELETSKEELQSVNEELVTVNHELKSNVEELSQANADLTNLMASTDIGTLFLDRQFRIQRFTPSAQKIFNLLPADVGRPIADITHKLEYKSLLADAEQVLSDLRVIEREVRVGPGAWYLTRIAPYRTSEDRIAGVVATFIDITRRKAAEDELRQSEARYRAMFEQAHIGIVQVDRDGHFLAVNPGACALSGYSKDELLRMTVKDVTVPEDFAEEEELTARLLAGEVADYSLEKRYLRKDGAIFWGNMTATLVQRSSDEPPCILAIVEPIGERKSAEEKLRASEERFRQFAENSADVLWIIDPKKGKLDYVSPAYERIWGESRNAILRDVRHWRKMVHPDDVALAAARVPQILGGKTFVHNYRIVRPVDGEMRWIRDTVFPVRDENGRVVRIAGVAQDVTDDNERGAALRESEERFRLLVEGAPEYAMLMLDPGNHIIYWSAGAVRVFGWTSDEALGKSGELIFTPEDRAREQEEKEMAIARRDGSAPDRRWHMRKDGSRIWVDGVMHRLDNEKGELRGYAKIARDASDQRAAEEALQKSHGDLERRVSERTAELRQINRDLQREIEERSRLEKEILLISEREKRRIGQDLHDSLCQELAATAFLLESKAQTLRAAAPDQAEAFSESARVVNANVGLARDLARGMHPVELSTGGLASALRELCYSVSHSKVDCRFHCPKPIRVRDEAVALNLYRIAQEALSNTVKHGDPSDVEICIKRVGKNLVLRVKDDGDGFGLEDPTDGMGIHIMRYRATAMGGKLTVESKKNDGTVIICTVPGA